MNSIPEPKEFSRLTKSVFSLLFLLLIILAVLTVYIKYSKNCNLLGKTYGSLVCRKKINLDTIKHKPSTNKPVQAPAQISAKKQPPPPPPPVYETPGLIVANNKLTISSLRAGRIKSIPYNDGQSFSKDDILITFDCQELALDLAVQTAIAKDKAAVLDNLKQLQELKSTSKYSVIEAESQLEQTKKLIEKLEYQITNCVIKANYDGKIITVSVTEGEYVSAGQALMTVNNTKDLLIKAYVPFAWISWLKQGTTFKLCLSKTCYKGIVNRIGAEVEPTSQTIDVFGKLMEPIAEPEKLIAGLSGQITFDNPT